MAKFFQRFAVILYAILIALLALYSFSLTDPNITFVNHALWTNFRNVMVDFGYYDRPHSWLAFIALIIALFSFHMYFVKHAKKYAPLHIALVAGLILIFAYPFLSRDLFNYMFDARILTTYGANPYTHRAADFPADSWLRFMHWTHRPYPYGPIFLPLTLIPSLLSFGKFAMGFILFKLLFVVAYVFTVLTLQKRDRTWAIFFATHPLVLIEGLVNGHNDLISVWFGLMGLLALKNRLAATALFGLSAGIKYFTSALFALLIPLKRNIGRYIAFVGVTAPILYISLTGEPQSWYYLNFLIFIPYFFGGLSSTYIFSFGLLMSYYPFIALGDWGRPGNTELKHMIIIIFALLQIAHYFFMKKFSRRWSFMRKGA